MASTIPTRRLMLYCRQLWRKRINQNGQITIKKALLIIADDLPGLFYADASVIYGVSGRVHDFIQRADGTIKIVTPENNVWVD